MCPSPAAEAAARESAILSDPPNFCVSDWDKLVWRTVEEDMLSGQLAGMSTRLSVTYVLTLQGDCKLSTKADLRPLFNPKFPARGTRYQFLVSIRQLAKDGREKAKPSTLEPDDLREFLRPLLPQDHPWLSAARFRDDLVFDRTPISKILATLNKMGLRTDERHLSYLQGLLRPLLPAELVSDAPISIPVPWSPDLDVAQSVWKVQSMLDQDVAPHWVAILAYPRCPGGQALLREGFRSGMVAHLFSMAMQQFERETLPPRKLTLLAVAYEIHVHCFADAPVTNQSPRLPTCLKPEGRILLGEAVVSYAQVFHQNNLLQTLAPLALPLYLSGDRANEWEDLWHQLYPPNWLPDMDTSAEPGCGLLAVTDSNLTNSGGDIRLCAETNQTGSEQECKPLPNSGGPLSLRRAHCEPMEAPSLEDTRFPIVPGGNKTWTRVKASLPSIFGKNKWMCFWSGELDAHKAKGACSMYNY